MGERKEEHNECTLKQEPDQLSSRHRALMRSLIAGIPLIDAARTLGYSIQRASVISNSELFKKEKARMEKEVESTFIDSEGSKVQTDKVRARLKDEALPSLNKVIELRDKGSEKVQQTSAFDILDRAGYKSPEKIETDATVEVGPGLADAIKEAVKAIKAKDAKGVESG